LFAELKSNMLCPLFSIS